MYGTGTNMEKYFILGRTGYPIYPGRLVFVLITVLLLLHTLRPHPYPLSLPLVKVTEAPPFRGLGTVRSFEVVHRFSRRRRNLTGLFRTTIAGKRI